MAGQGGQGAFPEHLTQPGAPDGAWELSSYRKTKGILGEGTAQRKHRGRKQPRACGLLRVQGKEDTEWEAAWWQVGSGYGGGWRNAKVGQWVIPQEAPPQHYQQGSPLCILAKGFNLGENPV